MSKLSHSILVVFSLVGLLGIPAGTLAAAYFSPAAEAPPPEIRESPTSMFMYPNGMMLRNMVMIRESPTKALPGPGDSATIDSFFDVYAEVSTDGGATWASSHTVGSPLEMEMSNVGGGGGGGILYTGVVKWFNDKKGFYTIRESPTLVSSAEMEVRNNPGGGYMIDSFFDIFTEISVDDGLSWVPSSGPVHMEGTPEPATLSLLTLGGLALLRRSRRK